MNRDEAKEYIMKGNDLDKASMSDGKTLLMHFCETGDLEMVRLLLEKGANVNVTRTAAVFYKTAIGYAWQYRRWECAELLLEHGADPNSSLGPCWSLLDRSVVHHNIDVTSLRLLLKYKPNLESINLNGRTPVQEAANRGNFTHFQLLVDAGAETKDKQLPEWAMKLLRCQKLTKQMARTMFWIVKKEKRLGRDVARIVAEMIWSARWMEVSWN